MSRRLGYVRGSVWVSVWVRVVDRVWVRVVDRVYGSVWVRVGDRVWELRRLGLR